MFSRIYAFQIFKVINRICKDCLFVDKRIQIIVVAVAVVFSVLVLTSPNDPIPLPKPTSNSENEFVTILAENLDKPRAIAVSEDRIFVTEKDGLIRVIVNNTLLDSPLATFRTANVFDGGLLGITLHPNFSNHHLILKSFQIRNQDLVEDEMHQKLHQFLHTIFHQVQILKIHH